MKLHLQVGDLVLTVKDCDYTKREIRDLLKTMSSIYLAIVEASAPAPEREANPIGFSAHLERAPDLAVEDYYTDDDE